MNNKSIIYKIFGYVACAAGVLSANSIINRGLDSLMAQGYHREIYHPKPGVMPMDQYADSISSKRGRTATPSARSPSPTGTPTGTPPGTRTPTKTPTRTPTRTAPPPTATRTRTPTGTPTPPPTNTSEPYTPSITPTVEPTATYISSPTPGIGDKGDVNNDGRINTTDAIMAFRIALGLYEPTPDEFWRADANSNDRVDTGDALCIFAEALMIPNPCFDPGSDHDPVLLGELVDMVREYCSSHPCPPNP